MRVNAVVIGGGALGSAAAVSTLRRLRSGGASNAQVCLVEKSSIAAGLSARHSGIVRAANVQPVAAKLGQAANEYWRNLDSLWGVGCDVEVSGALWIARETAPGTNASWAALADAVTAQGIRFEQIERARAEALCGDAVKLYDDEIYYHEPDALQLDPAAVRQTLCAALDENGVDVREGVAVESFICDRAQGAIRTVCTSAGDIECEHVVNAAGAWSPSLFASLGIDIPVSAETVNVANWIVDARVAGGSLPIVADYVQRAYFRTWTGGQLHMHQPRRRGAANAARTFGARPLQLIGAELVNDPANQALDHLTIDQYRGLMRHRFRGCEDAVYASGYRSYFDITPDLNFILGRDHRVGNLVHCLGAGQALKYTPVLGEIAADCVTGSGVYLSDLAPFAIERFGGGFMAEFLATAAPEPPEAAPSL